MFYMLKKEKKNELVHPCQGYSSGGFLSFIMSSGHFSQCDFNLKTI